MCLLPSTKHTNCRQDLADTLSTLSYSYSAKKFPRCKSENRNKKTCLEWTGVVFVLIFYIKQKNLRRKEG